MFWTGYTKIYNKLMIRSCCSVCSIVLKIFKLCIFEVGYIIQCIQCCVSLISICTSDRINTIFL